MSTNGINENNMNINMSMMNMNNTYGSFTVINSNFTPFNNQMVKEEHNSHGNSPLNNYNRIKEVSHLIKNDGSYENDDDDSLGEIEYQDNYKDNNMYEMIKVGNEQQENQNENYDEMVNEENNVIPNDENQNDFKNLTQDEVDEYEGEGNYISRYDRFS
jgi:hypothetical protein